MKVRMRWMIEEIIDVPDDTNWSDLENKWIDNTDAIEDMLSEMPGNTHAIEYDLEEM